MASTNFIPGTTIASTWLNDVDAMTYQSTVNARAAPYNAKGDGVTDDTAALQAAINACATTSQFGGHRLFLPAGNYKITAPLSIPREFISILGEGQWQTQILFTGVAGGAIKTASMAYLRPVFRDFALVGDTTSGHAIDFSNIFTQVYLGELKNLYLQSGLDTLYSQSASGNNFFSMSVENISVFSYNGHGFRVACGPGVTWKGCYALQAGPNKAGYRLTGTIVLLSCNGLNSGDYWGIFGNDLSAVDGFQTDFNATDLPDISMVGCNVEHYCTTTTSSSALLIHNAYRQFFLEGGKFDRTALSTAYHSIVRLKKSPNAPGNTAKLSPGSIFAGSGTPSGAYLYTDGQAVFEDQGNAFTGGGITTFNQTGLAYPLLTDGAGFDVFNGVAYAPNALFPRRITQRMLRYDLLTLTPGAATNQSVSVTGYTKVQITASGAYSVSNFTFDQTIGANLDYLRNGELIIENGNNTNLTLNHNVGSQYGMRLTGGANLVVPAGGIVRFMWSNNYASGVAGWVQT